MSSENKAAAPLDGVRLAEPEVRLRPVPVARPKMLSEEIVEICLSDGRYPTQWPRHEACPACGGKDLVVTFSKLGFNHDECRSCEFVFVNPFPPSDIIARLYAGDYYTNTRE